MGNIKWKDLLCNERTDRKTDFPNLYSSEFKRDYYAIVTSPYFRMLKDKTQVYSLDKKGFVRGRLTHSIEVSTIAGIIAEKVAEDIIQNHGEDISDYDGDFKADLITVAQCAGLLHDIGNPPFGHSGEQYIREWMYEKSKPLEKNTPDTKDEDKYNLEKNRSSCEKEVLSNVTEEEWTDLTNFEGNAQNLRIITKLADTYYPYTNLDWNNLQDNGLNLTYAVIGSIIKYPVSASEAECTKNKKMCGKMGYYLSEKDIFTKVEERLGLKDGKGRYYKNPIMFIMEAADDIAYGVSDIEDALSNGDISVDEFAESLNDNDFNKKLENIRNQTGSQDKDQNIARDTEVLLRYTIEKIRESAIIGIADVYKNNYDDILNGTFYEDKNESKEDLIHVLWDNNKEDPILYALKKFKDLIAKIYPSRDAKSENSDMAKDRIYRVMECLWRYIIDEKNLQELKMREGKIFLPKKYFGDDEESLVRHYYVGSKFRHVLEISRRNGQSDKTYYDLMAINDFISSLSDPNVEQFLNDVYSSEGLEIYSGKIHVQIQSNILRLYDAPNKIYLPLNALSSAQLMYLMTKEEAVMAHTAITGRNSGYIDELANKKSARGKRIKYWKEYVEELIK